MAVAKLSCGACGAALPGGAPVCPRCGESVQLPAAAAVAGTCPVCGHRNVQSGAFCEDCGASLARAAAPPREESVPKEKPRTGRKIERWKIAGGLLVGVVLVLFGYLELNRPPAPPPSAPPGQAATQAEPPMEEVRRLQEAVRANPGNADDLLQLANRLHDLGLSAPTLLPGAIEAYTNYLKLKPGDPNARVDLGICYFELGRTDSLQSPKMFSAAVREMKAAIASTPGHQPAAFNLGIVCLFMGDAKESAKWFRKTIELGPDTELGTRAKNLLAQHAFPSSTP
jgi:cytochrome c-type biogenesis protein CcmH/NrfG